MARRATGQTLIVDGITVEVRRSAVRHVRISVHPPAGAVRVSVPRFLPERAVRDALRRRMAWIQRTRTAVRARPREAERRYVTGETHLFLGERYRLEVESPAGAAQSRRPRAHVTLDGTTIRLLTSAPSDQVGRERAISAWYREQLTALIPELRARWEPIVGAAPSEVRIRRMTTLWGSCNVVARRVWLNLELARRPVRSIEYVLVHELVHLHERYHNARFYRLMGEALPDWRERREELNATPIPGRFDDRFAEDC